MAIEKYICSCGAKVNKLTSFFSTIGRITVCDECADRQGLNKNKEFEAVDYEIVKNDFSKQVIDTREKQ
jgi:hypothetical protein